jgi:hypothetical protein
MQIFFRNGKPLQVPECPRRWHTGSNKREQLDKVPPKEQCMVHLATWARTPSSTSRNATKQSDATKRRYTHESYHPDDTTVFHTPWLKDPLKDPLSERHETRSEILIHMALVGLPRYS